MTNKEKEALKDCNIIFMNLEDMMSEESANDARKSYKIILNLIEKQSKEIEELKEEYNTKLLSNAGIYQLGFNDGIKTVEGKIKTKIEELNEHGYCEYLVSRDLELTILILKELIGGIKC